MGPRSSGPQSFRLLALPATTAGGRALPAPGNTAARLATELGAGTSRCRRWRATEGAPAHAQAALAQPVSVAAEGDVDTEVVVVVAAPAALPKATILDLSCNKLTALPSDFCGLTHLVKLDLSKNKLRQLPADFGRLVNLQHLDLLNNRLVTLPVSFAQLKSLKWLDLKDNPLDPVLAKVAGDCLDEKQCKQCANKVLQHMKAVQVDQERERQRRLEIDREAEKKWEAKQRAKEAQERELRKREKAEEKERRRKEYDALKAAKREQEKKPKKEANQAPKSKSGSRPRKPPPRKHTRSWAVLRLLLLLLLLCVAGGLVACRVTELQQQPLCTSVNTIYDSALRGLRSHDILRWVLQTDSQQ
ncbi:leucine-rich repeat-containing protein 59 isoform X1 [Phocoena sinus]|uniref:Leucine-rich repeat-containing protein 59 n=1 Tax=Phocoena sinus TaxID=42100 RepID=A0A8C9C801_PHOSS|nr:leucine-rich repeat-containing protein 59 isoform X1 [Phocoena sinus]